MHHLRLFSVFLGGFLLFAGVAIAGERAPSVTTMKMDATGGQLSAGEGIGGTVFVTNVDPTLTSEQVQVTVTATQEVRDHRGNLVRTLTSKVGPRKMIQSGTSRSYHFAIPNMSEEPNVEAFPRKTGTTPNTADPPGNNSLTTGPVTITASVTGVSSKGEPTKAKSVK